MFVCQDKTQILMQPPQLNVAVLQTFSMLYSDSAFEAISTASCCIWSPMSAFLMTALRCSLMVKHGDRKTGVDAIKFMVRRVCLSRFGVLGVLEDRSVGFKNLNGLFQELIFILNSFAYFSKDLNVGGAFWSLIIISTFAIAIEP